MDIWTRIEADRGALADYLGALSPDDWSTQSLCAGWTVKAVTAHMLVIPTMSRGQVFGSFLTSGFNLDKMNAKLVEKTMSERSTTQMVTATRESAVSRSMPPGLKPLGVLSEVLIHAADISEVVDAPLDFPVDDYVASLDHLKGVKMAFGCKKRISGLELRATDATWATGAGPTVEGTAKHLLLAMTGRSSALDNLAGEGVATMRTR